MGEPQSWSGHSGKKKKIPSLPLLGNEPWSTSLYLVTTLTELEIILQDTAQCNYLLLPLLPT